MTSNPAIQSPAKTMPAELIFKLPGKAEIFLLVSFLIMVSPVYATRFLLLDDNWLVRGGEVGYPSLNFISAGQGRPIFAGLIALLRVLPINDFLNKMQVAHFFGVVIQSINILLISRLFFWCTGSRIVSLCGSLFCFSLPPWMIYVTGGGLVSIGFTFTLLAFILFFFAFYHGADSKVSRAFFLIVSTLLLLASFSTYQPTAFIIPALCIFVIGKKAVNRESNWIKPVACVMLWMFSCLVIYFIAWRLLGTNTTMGYTPEPQTLSVLFRKLIDFVDIRVSQVLNFWHLTPMQTGDPEKGPYFLIALIAVLASFCAIILYPLRKQEELIFTSHWRPVAAGGIIISALLLISDFCYFAAPTQLANRFNYILLAPASLAITGLLCIGTIIAVKNSSGQCWQSSFFCHSACFCMLTSIMVMGYTMGDSYHWKRLRTEVKTYRGILNDARNSLGSPGLIHIDLYSAPITFAQYEYGWSNLGSSFYIHWLTRNILDEELGGSDIRIEILDKNTGQLNVAPSSPPVDASKSTWNITLGK